MRSYKLEKKIIEKLILSYSCCNIYLQTEKSSEGNKYKQGNNINNIGNKYKLIFLTIN